MENYAPIFHYTSPSSAAPPPPPVDDNHHHNQMMMTTGSSFVSEFDLHQLTHDPLSYSNNDTFGGGGSGGGSGGGGDQSEVKSGKKKTEKKIKKPKYAFQTRSQVDILDDGYRWRKYGQKAVKNNKFPRSYYRCTHQGCNVKKQVQRLSKDEGVVVTTYEGMHSHPIEKSTDNFEHILSQMQIYNTAF